jgi:manganese transport protein
LSFLPALGLIFLINDPFKGLIISQMFLSIQLPITVFTQVYLTSNKKVMGKYVNSRATTLLLVVLGLLVTGMNMVLLVIFI